MSKPPVATQPRGRPRNPLEVWGTLEVLSVPPGGERAGGKGEEEDAEQSRREKSWAGRGGSRYLDCSRLKNDPKGISQVLISGTCATL